MEEIMNEELAHEISADKEPAENSKSDEPSDIDEITEQTYELDFDNDLREIREHLPAASPDKNAIAENERYAELRALGLTPAEAYLATRQNEPGFDNRSHLTAALPKSSPITKNQMSRQELDMARSLFGELDDSELRSLYKRVTK